MRAVALRLAGLVAWALAAGGCASILGIEEQSLESTDAGGDGAALDATADTSSGGDGPSIESGDSSPPLDSSAPLDSGATDSMTPVCASGTRSCAGPQPTLCSGGVWQNDGAPCTGTTLCVDGGCTVPPPSCAKTGAGLTTCGAGNESCCAHLPVTGGTYSRTYTNTGGGPTAASDPSTVSAFRLDEYEVTVGRFRVFVAAWNDGSGFAPAAGSGRHAHLHGGAGLADAVSGTSEMGWVSADDARLAPTDANLGSCVASGVSYSTWTPSVGADESLPINCVSWYEAYAFCIWDGGFLPSEAEWEYASAGGALEREYPWGTTPPGTASQYAIYGCDYPGGSGICTGPVNFAPVGTAALGVGLWGQVDLAGNVLEWNLDGYAAYVDPCSDCAYLTPGASRVTRGGGAGYDLASLVPTARNSLDPTFRDAAVGIRCARTP